ncbi:MAG: M48 family metallopeptidase [Aristaeellaceae bacterium]
MQFGPYTIEVTVRRNCRHLILRCREGRLYLSVPPRTPKAAINAFLSARTAWMAEQVARTTAYEPQYAPGERHLVAGRYMTLGEEGVPAGEKAFLSFRAERLAEAVRQLLPLWEARMGVKAGSIRFREMVSRWGSCQTVTGHITLNLRLGLVPVECMEYVLVHELCHLLHPDHSAAFHDELTCLMPDWEARKRRLNLFDLRPLPPG